MVVRFKKGIDGKLSAVWDGVQPRSSKSTSGDANDAVGPSIADILALEALSHHRALTVGAAFDAAQRASAPPEWLELQSQPGLFAAPPLVTHTSRRDVGGLSRSLMLEAALALSPVVGPRNETDQPRRVVFVPDDAGIELLGNALLLGWTICNIEVLDLVRKLRSCGVDNVHDLAKQIRTTGSESARLRDCLAVAGALDSRLEADGEGIDAGRRRLKSLAEGASELAKLRVRDLDQAATRGFPAMLQAINIARTKGYMYRTPIARLGPCAATEVLYAFVIGYLTAPVSPGEGGPRSAQEVSREEQARSLIAELLSHYPSARVTSDEIRGALKGANFSQKACGRIWGSVSKGHGIPGRVPKNAARLPEGALAIALRGLVET